jgi:serine/threonine-protein kinase
MGSVYLAYDETEKCQVALKVLSDQLASNASYVERFYREARSGAHLDHPHIVRCISAGQDSETGKYYLVLEYVAGPNAHTLIDQFGHLTVGDAVHIILDVARALEYAHSRSIIHRDIKPDNILITRSGVAKLADLGLAKRTDEESHLTALRQGFGSLYYVPCEQAFNAKQADARSDIYALGATLYHLLTGELPFSGKSHTEIAEKKVVGSFAPASALKPDVPPALDRILLKMMARSPEDRYQLVSEVIVDLERANLAAPVPSFADRELALQDPLVQARLSAAQSTQLDLQSSVHRAPLYDDGPMWHLRFRNRDGQWCKTKLSQDKLLQRLREGRIPKGLQAARQAHHDFHPLAYYPELHLEPLAAKAATQTAEAPEAPQTVVTMTGSDPATETTPPRSPISPWVWVGAAICVGLTLALGALAFWFMQTP